MEESKTQTYPCQRPKTQHSPPSRNPASASKPHLPRSPISQHTKKRKLDHVDIRNSPYFKIRALVSRLRPQFIEVLRTPDFRNCEAAQDIQRKMKLVMDLYRQMTTEVKTVQRSKPLSSRTKKAGEKLVNQQGQQYEKFQSEQVPQRSELQESPLHQVNPAMMHSDGIIQGSYIVGGSGFGWNFITYSRGKPVYYGVTKAVFRNRRGHEKSAARKDGYGS